MGDLFSDAAATQAPAIAPLPHRVRPRTLDELVGQQDVLGPGTALRRAIEEGRAPSMILHGPPGVGRRQSRGSSPRRPRRCSRSCRPSRRGSTTSARSSRALATGWAGTASGRLLFIDEIHRFDKRQQDSVLHAVEDGLVTLIGATTENPYFEVNQALLSRCTVIELEPLTLEQLDEVIAARCGERSPRTRRPRSWTRSHAVPAATRAPRSRRSSSPGRPRPPPARGSPSSTSRTPLASGRCGTTAPATGTTTSRRPSSSRCAAATPTRPSTTSRRCSRAARTRASSHDGS